MWAKYGGAQGFPLVLWDVCIIPKYEVGLDLIDIAMVVFWNLNGLLDVSSGVLNGRFC